jgi:hypothetical protein
MTASTTATETWYGHLDSIDATLAAKLESNRITEVGDLYDVLGAELAFMVGEDAAARIAKELAPDGC